MLISLCLPTMANSEWSEECFFDKKKFVVKFSSASGDPFNEEDHTAEFIIGKHKRPIPIPKTFYSNAGALTNTKNLCQRDEFTTAKLTATKAGDDKIILWLTQNNRPLFDLLTLVLININTGETLDVVRTNKMIKAINPEQRLVIIEENNKFKIRLIGEWLGLDDSQDGAIEHWMWVSVAGNKIIFDPTID